MQLSNREKLLVLILSILALIAAFFYFVEKPQLEKITALKKVKLDFQQKVQTLNIQTSTKNPIYKESEDLEKKIKELTIKFFPTINQEKIITILDAKFATSKFQPDSITFDVKDLAIPTDNANKESESEKEKHEDLLGDMSMAFHSLKPISSNAEVKIAKDKKTFETALGSINRLGVSLTFEGDYEGLSLFVKQIEVDKRRVVIDSIQCEKSDSDRLKGTIELSFYAIPKLFFQDDDYYQWNYANKYGKYNPFFLNGGTINPSTTASNSGSSVKADFFISLKPTTSDVQSVMIGKKGADLSSTIISADNPYNENLEMQINKSGNKYYYHYRLSKSSYPADYTKQEEFVPNGNQIVIEVLSSKRQSIEDHSGANIKIVNNTDLKILANVLFDDKKDHRAKFVNNVGNVVVSSSMEE